ncbi:MAG: HAD-IA family hydrolase [Prolixibacteraceae bacterium]|nr:HAD-IA family hydrolase [Prolixibacteraceae bacterium]
MKKKIMVDPKAKALIFDIDGTLADTMPAHFAAFRKVLGRYGINMSPELFQSIAGIPVLPQMYMFLEQYQPKGFIPEKVAKEKEDEYFKTIGEMQAIHQVFEVMKAYSGILPIACGTGGDRRIATKTLEVIGASPMVDALVTCDDVQHGKPAPDTFLLCAKLLGIEPVLCQVFEDGQPGIDAALAAGMMVTDVREFL